MLVGILLNRAQVAMVQGGGGSQVVKISEKIGSKTKVWDFLLFCFLCSHLLRRVHLFSPFCACLNDIRKVYFLASKQADVLEAWKNALSLELQKAEAEREAGSAAAGQLLSAATFGLEEGAPAGLGDGGEGGEEFDTTELDHRKTMDLKDLVSKESPSKLYGNFVKIGRGAFSNVWTAEDKATGEKVAIKVRTNREQGATFTFETGDQD